MTDSTRRKIHPIMPHFFQPLLPNFLTNFSIPGSFLKYLEGDDNAKKEKIARLRDMRKEIWKVKISNDRKHFKYGWKEFCKDHDLQVGDFLVFRHQGNLIFDVFIFDPTSACEREFPAINPSTLVKSSSLTHPTSNGVPEYGKGDYEAYSAKEVAFKPRGYPYCHTFVRPYCLRWSGMGSHE